MEIRTYPRATAPHLPSLADATAAFLPRWYGRFDKGVLEIASNDFAGTTDAAIQAAVTAAPDDSAVLQAKSAVGTIGLLERAAYLTLLDWLNVERARHQAPPFTKADFILAVRNRVDTA